VQCKVNHPRLAWRELRGSPCKLFFRTLAAVTVLLLYAAAGVSQTAPATSEPKESLAKAETLLNEGKAEEALNLLHDVAANDPNLPGLEAMLGKACFQTRRFPQAIQHLSAALQQKPGDLETTQVLALTYFASGDYQQALPLLEKIGPNLPKLSADGPYLLGICYIMTQRWDDARKTFAQMFSVPPDSSMAYLMFGKILIRQRMEQRAIPEIEKALEMDSRLPMAHFLLGELALYKKDPQGAVNEFQKELAVNPTVWLVYWRLGDAYVRMENYDEAEKVLKQAIWLNEWSSGAYILLGQIALKKDESGIAVGFLERALKLDPNNYWVHYFLAKAYHNVGRTAEATQHFEISKSLRNDQLADDRNMLQTVP
jgi:tetratricopeptide (TPR) repeat protein